MTGFYEDGAVNFPRSRNNNSAIRQAVACMPPSAVTAGNVSTEPSQVVIAAAPIVRKPSNADARPACFPNGPIVIAVPNGLANPIPQRYRLMDKVYQAKPGVSGPISSRLPPNNAVRMPPEVMICGP
ncbi:Uncharacterised protein [Serratia plymuthica]|nr:Uncharacterised protein [Serratia plymuthica]